MLEVSGASHDDFNDVRQGFFDGIREYRSTDYQQVVELLSESGLFDSARDSEKALLRKSESDNRSIVVYESEGKISGQLFLTRDGWAGICSPIALRTGESLTVAEKLLLRAECQLIADDIKMITVFVPSERAELITFYKSAGYEVYKEQVQLARTLDPSVTPVVDDVAIRPYKDSDFEQLREMLSEAGLFDSTMDTRENLRVKSSSDPRSMLVATENERVIGSVFTIFDDRGSMLSHLGVATSYRGKAPYARRLGQVADNELRDRGLLHCVTYADAQNLKLLGAYKRVGYKSTGRVVPVFKAL